MTHGKIGCSVLFDVHILGTIPLFSHHPLHPHHPLILSPSPSSSHHPIILTPSPYSHTTPLYYPFISPFLHLHPHNIPSSSQHPFILTIPSSSHYPVILGTDLVPSGNANQPEVGGVSSSLQLKVSKVFGSISAKDVEVRGLYVGFAFLGSYILLMSVLVNVYMHVVWRSHWRHFC